MKEPKVKRMLTLVVEGEHALGAVEVGGVGLQPAAHDGVEERHVQQAHEGEAHGGHERQVVHAFLLLLGSVIVAVAVGVVVTVLVLLVLCVIGENSNNKHHGEKLSMTTLHVFKEVHHTARSFKKCTSEPPLTLVSAMLVVHVACVMMGVVVALGVVVLVVIVL